MTIRYPPGRAGKVYLRDRLQAAVHGAELLERKQVVLTREHSRLTALTDQTARDWRAHYDDTAPAMLRLLLLGGRTALERTCAEAPAASAQVRWQSAMGVSYPAQIAAVLADPPELNGPAPLRTAVDAHRAALESAVQHAAASFALQRIDAELESTYQRLRAVRDRLVPELRLALHRLELALDETDREEAARTGMAHPESNPITGRGRAAG
jgi:V/A-type H+-transporting ATPase subunit D